MRKQVFSALRNVALTICLVSLGMLVYNVLILRGRSFEWDYFDQHKWSFRSILAQPEPEKFPVHFSTNVYRIRLLADGRYERQLSNNSLIPLLVTMYEFKDWEYRLPTSMLFMYANRYSVHSPAYGGSINSGMGFGCGTGLGYSLIRPLEAFTDTIVGENLFRQLSVYEFTNKDEEDMLIDKFTGKIYGPAADFNWENQDKLLELMPDDSLSIRFYLPVTAWTNLAHSRFESNPIKVSRRELIYLHD